MQLSRAMWAMVAAASCLAAVLVLGQPSVALADTITVTNVNDSGAGSLREAITLLNQRQTTSLSPHLLQFQIRPAQCAATSHVCTIILLSPLPSILQPMTLDGWSQGGAGYQGPPLVELNGASTGGIGVNGLTIWAGSVTVRGFVINRFSGNGIQIGALDAAPYVSRTLISGSYIGTDATGNLAQGNGFAGVLIANSIFTSIRSVGAPSTGNVISGNTFGIVTNAGASTGHADGIVISGNKIGTTADGARALGNRREGILISQGRIIGIGAGKLTPEASKNTIAFNGSHGISVISGANIEVGDNDIYENAGLGINLGDDGVTPNDALDQDSGPNGLQNFPVILAARLAGNTTVITGVLNSEPSAYYHVRFFLAPGCTDGGVGQGRQLLAEQEVQARITGDVSFTVAVPTLLANGDSVVATATMQSGGGFLVPDDPHFSSTSEFSPCRTVTDPGLLVGHTGTVETTEAGGSVAIPFSLAAPPTADVQIPFTSSNTREGTVSAATLTFTPANWNLPQMLTIRGVDDDVADGDVPYTVQIGPLVSADAGYNGLDPADLPVVNHDNEGTPALSVADASLPEGNSGTSRMTFTVTLAPPSIQTVRVSFSTAPGSARQSDFTENFGTLTFAPGETRKTFTVSIVGDTAVEPDEDFFVNLFSPEQAVIARAQARGVITNDDSPVTTCSPRPNPKVQTAHVGPGRLQVTVTSQTSATLTANALQRFDFDAGENARVEIPGAAAGSPGGPSASGGPSGAATAFSLPLAGAPTTQTFIVQRQQPGPFKVSFGVVDGCSGAAGPFRTFVGGGAGVP